MELITPHISYREATFSVEAIRRGIDNTPDEQQLEFIRQFGINLFEPLREGLGDRPIYFNSLFRCMKLNKVVKGAKNSQHMCTRGAAGDIDNDNNPDGPVNLEIFNFIRDHLEFDQLIWEEGDDSSPGWVHVSYFAGHNRLQILRSRNRKYSFLFRLFGLNKRKYYLL